MTDTEITLAWLVEHSEGVVGLKLDGTVMPWSDVFFLYMPRSAPRRPTVADREPALVHIEFDVCLLCLSAAGGECHVPGCAFFMQDAPLGSSLAWLRQQVRVPFCAGRSHVAHPPTAMCSSSGGGWQCPVCGEGDPLQEDSMSTEPFITTPKGTV